MAFSEEPVAPLAGAWIEMISVPHNTTFYYVAPLAGAWIEMLQSGLDTFSTIVAPLAGAWIEMLKSNIHKRLGSSLPSRERGLKCLSVA